MSDPRVRVTTIGCDVGASRDGRFQRKSLTQAALRASGPLAWSGRWNAWFRVGALMAVMAALAAGALVWILLTDPASVTVVVDSDDVSPLALRLARVIYSAVLELLRYL
jgi:hypothetical protein